jgi:hypothetical protein
MLEYYIPGGLLALGVVVGAIHLLLLKRKRDNLPAAKTDR